MPPDSDGTYKSQKEQLQLLDTVKCIKTSLTSIVDQNKINDLCDNLFVNTFNVDNIECTPNKYILQKFLPVLEDIVHRVNVIKYHAYNFIRLFVLYEYENFNTITVIDEKYVLLVMKIVSLRTNKSGRQSMDKELEIKITDFFNNVYSNTINVDQLVYDDKLCFILHYEALDIIKNIETNISEHFTDKLNQLINLKYKIKKLVKNAKNIKIEDLKNMLIKEYYKILKVIKEDIHTKREKIESNILQDFIKDVQYNGLPNRPINKNVSYDVKINPQEYLKHYIWINKELENMSTSENELRLYNVTPLSLSLIPKHITIDTPSLINILLEYGVSDALKNVNKCKQEMWSLIFNLDAKIFKKNGYAFNNMIKTDGISCSIIFAKNEYIKNGQLKKINIGTAKKMKTLREVIENAYIEENIDKIKENYATTDPNFGNMLNMIGKNNKRIRYTRNQRNNETKNKKYKMIRKSVDEKNAKIKESEDKLTKCNFKSCDFKEMVKYITIKNEIEREVKEHYRQKIYRKLKLNTYIMTQKSETEMIRKIKKEIGRPEKTTIIYGDYSGKQMKGKEPLISKRIRRCLREAKYDVYLIDEFRTSKLCNKCEHEVCGFKRIISKRPKTIGQEVELWELRRCLNLDCNVTTKKGDIKRTILNRDDNSALNMRKIVENLIKNKKRPEKYCRDCHTDKRSG
jgi:hypothetical protein